MSGCGLSDLGPMETVLVPVPPTLQMAQQPLPMPLGGGRTLGLGSHLNWNQPGGQSCVLLQVMSTWSPCGLSPDIAPTFRTQLPEQGEGDGAQPGCLTDLLGPRP